MQDKGTNIAGNLSVFSVIVLYIALLVQSALLVHSVLLYMYMYVVHVHLELSSFGVSSHCPALMP